MALNGSLDDYSPDGALRVLSSTGRTGAVRFTGGTGCTVYLDQGQLYFARANDTDEELAAALVRPGRLTADDWTTAVEEAGDEPRLAEVLVARGSIESDLLASVVLSVVYDPLITLFREGDGTFKFEPDVMHWIGASRAFNVDAIVNEVRRRVREVDEMSPLVPGISSWVTPARTLPDGAAQVTLLREDWELITSLQSGRTIVDLASDMGRGRYSAARVVHRLAEAGLVEVSADPADTSGGPAPHEPTAFERMRSRPQPEPESSSDSDDVVTPESPASDGDGDHRSDHDAESIGDPWTGGTWGSPWANGPADGGNPFEHPPLAEADGDSGPLTRGSHTDGPDTTSGEEASLPRRQRVAVQDPPHEAGFEEAWARTEATTIGDSPEATASPGTASPEIASPGTDGLSGISGFRNPVASGSQTVEGLAEATDGATHPNTEWLESLYAQFIDEPAAPPAKKRKKEALDVAFQADEQDEVAKTGTLKRLLGALRRV